MSKELTTLDSLSAFVLEACSIGLRNYSEIAVYAGCSEEEAKSLVGPNGVLRTDAMLAWDKPKVMAKKGFVRQIAEASRIEGFDKDAASFLGKCVDKFDTGVGNFGNSGGGFTINIIGVPGRKEDSIRKVQDV